MTNFEEMYKKFCLSEEHKELLLGFSRSEFSKPECAVKIKEKTIVHDNEEVKTESKGEE